MTTMTDNLGRRLSPLDAEKLLGIKRSTISTWHHRRTSTGLHAIGRDNKGDPWFWEVDLKAVKYRIKIWDSEGERRKDLPDLVKLAEARDTPQEPR